MAWSNGKRQPPPLDVSETPGTPSHGLFTDEGGMHVSIDAGVTEMTGSPHEAVGDISPGNSADQDGDIGHDDLVYGEFLGEGNFGTVKKVTHRTTGDVYALKAIPVDCTEEVRKQILMELRTLKACKSPNIVAYYGAFYQEGSMNLLLELLSASLADVLKHSGPLPMEILAKVAKQVLLGLNYLHTERRLIHRDIKPSNLLLSRTGAIKISDFGVSAKMGDSLARRLTFTGTVTYMSPERIRGDGHSFDSDVWSLGLTIFELASGSFPYRVPKEGFWEMLSLVCDSPSPRVPDSFPKSFRRFIACCLEKSPTERLSAAELLEHEFIKEFSDNPVDIGVWADHVVSKIQAERHRQKAQEVALADLSERDMERLQL